MLGMAGLWVTTRACCGRSPPGLFTDARLALPALPRLPLTTTTHSTGTLLTPVAPTRTFILPYRITFNAGFAPAPKPPGPRCPVAHTVTRTTRPVATPHPTLPTRALLHIHPTCHQRSHCCLVYRVVHAFGFASGFTAYSLPWLGSVLLPLRWFAVLRVPAVTATVPPFPHPRLLTIAKLYCHCLPHGCLLFAGWLPDRIANYPLPPPIYLPCGLPRLRHYCHSIFPCCVPFVDLLVPRALFPVLDYYPQYPFVLPCRVLTTFSVQEQRRRRMEGVFLNVQSYSIQQTKPGRHSGVALTFSVGVRWTTLLYLRLSRFDPHI